MKTILIIACIAVVVLVLISVFLWANILGGGTPSGWRTYRAQEVGFQVDYPEYMGVHPFSNTQDPGVAFSFSGPEQETSPLDFVDGITFVVRMYQLDNQSFEELARSRSANAEPIYTAGLEGYQYKQGPEEEGQDHEPTRWFVLLPFSNNAFVELAYSFEDPNNQGYQQVVDQMVASFEIVERGSVSPIAIILGGLLVVSLAGGLGLYWVMTKRP